MGTGVVDPRTQAEGPARCRPFGLSDLMILLAGAALALASGTHLFLYLAGESARLASEAVAHRADLFAHRPLFWGAIRDPLRNALWYGLQALEVVLAGMTPAFLVVRSRRPRPPLGVLLRQPGMVAALAMVFGLFWGTGALHLLFPEGVDSFTAAPIAVGGAVAASWAALILTRVWKAEPGWVDRIGRLLGGAAIAAAFLGLVVHRI